MKIGIIVAMDRELQLLLPLLDEKKEVVAQSGVRMVSGTMEGHDIVVLKSGIGKVNAAVGASALIDFALPGLIINTGVAGGAGATNVLDVVVGAETAYHDVWCGPGTVPGQVQGLPARFAADARVMALDAVQDNPGIKCGLIASGDSFVDSPAGLERIRGLYPDVLAVDMEWPLLRMFAICAECLLFPYGLSAIRPGRVIIPPSIPIFGQRHLSARLALCAA